MTSIEKALFTKADLEKAASVGQTYSNPPDCCDQCNHSLDDSTLFVDGRLKGDFMWAIMCPSCFKRQGEGIAWGKGQLYQKQDNGDWLLVAGFSPED
jgi:hypothetical protein